MVLQLSDFWSHKCNMKVQNETECKCTGYHDARECSVHIEDIKCTNWQGPQPSYSKDCPRFKFAKEDII